MSKYVDLVIIPATNRNSLSQINLRVGCCLFAGNGYGCTEPVVACLWNRSKVVSPWEKAGCQRKIYEDGIEEIEEGGGGGGWKGRLESERGHIGLYKVLVRRGPTNLFKLLR